MRHDVRQLRKNLRISYDPRKLMAWKSHRVLDHVKEYFHMFFSTLKDIIWVKSKTNHLIG